MILPSILSPYTFYLKAAAVIAILLAVAYEQYWVYHQGQLTGRAAQQVLCQSAQDAITHRFNNQRVQDMELARRNYEIQLANEQKKVKDLNHANQILKAQKPEVQAFLDMPAPPDLVVLLNHTRGAQFGASDNSSGDKPTSGTSEKVRTDPPVT